jgi:hypothetical protein
MGVCKVYWDSPKIRPTIEQLEAATSQLQQRTSWNVAFRQYPDFDAIGAEGPRSGRHPPRIVSGGEIEIFLKEILPGYRYESAG